MNNARKKVNLLILLILSICLLITAKIIITSPVERQIAAALTDISYPWDSRISYTSIPAEVNITHNTSKGEITLNRSVKGKGYIVFIDEAPDYDWSHYAKLIFVSPQGEPEILLSGNMLPDFKFYINDNTRIKPEWQIYHTYEFRSFGPELTIMAILFIVITITGGAITAIKNETKYIKTLKRVSIMSLCIFGISMFAWHLLPLSRSDTGIIPRSYTPFIACISVFSAFILLSPLTCGFIYLFKKDNRFIGLKYIGFVGLGILLFTIAVLVKIYRTGVF